MTAEPSIPSADGHVTVVFTSDWGVSTGVGEAGRTHSTLEKQGDLPVVRGTVVAGVLREQAMIAARALDAAVPASSTGRKDSDGSGGPSEGSPWTRFAKWLFGDEGNNPRHVVFSDALPVRYSQRNGKLNQEPYSLPVHDAVSLSISPTTGAARDQMLRFTERAAPGVLAGTYRFTDEAGAEHRGYAHFLLGVAGLMVRGIGSGRSGGDGECTVIAGPVCATTLAESKKTAKQALRRVEIDKEDKPAYSSDDIRALASELREALFARLGGPSFVEQPPSFPVGGAEDNTGPLVSVAASRHSSEAAAALDPANWFEATLDIVLDSPVVSYEVPFSNEVRSLDFLRGTVLIPWLHRQLRGLDTRADGTPLEEGDEDLIRSAVVSGDLRVSDALPVYQGTPGLPVPLVFEQEKVPEDEVPAENKKDRLQPVTLFNRHIETGKQHCGEHTVPSRGAYVFLDEEQRPADTNGAAADEGAGPCGAAPASFDGRIGKPSLIGRQSTAIDPHTGAAWKSKLFLVRALPAGLRLRAKAVISRRLFEALAGAPVPDADGKAPTLGLGINEATAYLGSRRLTGTFGQATCSLGAFTELTAPPCPDLVPDETRPADSSPDSKEVIVSLWFTSDVLARSKGLGPGGTMTDLELAFERAGLAIPSNGVRQGDSPSSGENPGKKAEAVAESQGAAAPAQDSALPESQSDREPSPPCPDDSAESSDGPDDRKKTKSPRNRKQVKTAIRHRRVDSWSAADGGPRATRMAIIAGSVVQVKVPRSAVPALRVLGRIGVGELTPQGYGRFEVNHPALCEPVLPLVTTKSECFTAPEKSEEPAQEGEGR